MFLPLGGKDADRVVKILKEYSFFDKKNPFTESDSKIFTKNSFPQR